MTYSTLSGLGTKRRRRRSGAPVLVGLSLIMVLVAVALFVQELLVFSTQRDRLPTDATVAGVGVGRLTFADALARWESIYATPLLLYYADSPIQLDPASIGFRTNREAMLASARAESSIGGGFWPRFVDHLLDREATVPINIPISADYQQTLLRQFLDDVAARYDRAPGSLVVNVDTLSVGAGGRGLQLDKERAFTVVQNALFSPTERAVVLPVGGSDTAPTDLNALRELIVGYLNALGFVYDGTTTVASVYIMDLQTGEEISILGDAAFSAASTMKVPIMLEYFRRLTFAPSQEEAWLMANSLLCSNNSSSNLLMQIIGNGNLFAGLAEVNNTAQTMGARNTFISAPFDLGIPGQQIGSIARPATSPNATVNTQPDPYNQTTAEDLGLMFNMLYDCANYGSGMMTVFPDNYTQNECRQMLELMSVNDLNRLLQGGIPADVRISHKNGWIFDMVGDAGIVYPPNGRNYIIAVFVWEEADFQNFERLWPIVEDISRATWNYFSPEAALTGPRRDLPFTAQECEGNYLPPDMASVNLNDMRAWRGAPAVAPAFAAPTPTPLPLP